MANTRRCLLTASAAAGRFRPLALILLIQTRGRTPPARASKGRVELPPLPQIGPSRAPGRDGRVCVDRAGRAPRAAAGQGWVQPSGLPKVAWFESRAQTPRSRNAITPHRLASPARARPPLAAPDKRAASVGLDRLATNGTHQHHRPKPRRPRAACRADLSINSREASPAPDLIAALKLFWLCGISPRTSGRWPSAGDNFADR